MPSSATRGTVARQWELLGLLPSRGAGKTAAELRVALETRGYPVSKRQVERDLHELAQQFPLDRNDASIPFGWKWAHGAERSVSGMDVAEALSLAMAQDAVAPLLPSASFDLLRPRFAQAERKISELSATNSLAHWRSKVHQAPVQFSLVAPEVDATVTSVVHEALLAEEQLDVCYRQAGGGLRDLRLHPLGLIQRGPVAYLLATAWNYVDARLYALHRMTSASRTHEPSEKPQGFTLSTWLKESGVGFGDGDVIELRLRCEPELLGILRETPIAEGQHIEGDVVSARLASSWALEWWILSQGPSVEVLAPENLRRLIADSLRAALKNYVD